MLGLEPEKTIYDLVVAPGELDSEKLAGYTTRHASGVDVLRPAPPEDAGWSRKALHACSRWRGLVRRIIVDTSPFFHGPMLATLDRTDDLLLLCGLDADVRTRLSLQTLELLSFLRARVRVVNARTRTSASSDGVERALETKIRADLPSDRAVPLGVNRGKPVALADPGSDFAKAIADLAKGLVSAATASKGKAKVPSKKRMFARSRS
jgi:Flp pilus assembly CpaE family ATPase